MSSSRRDDHQRIVGKHLGDQAAEGGVKRGAAAGGVGENGTAAGHEVSAKPFEVFGREAEVFAAVNVNERVVDQVGIGGKQLVVVDHHIKSRSISERQW